MAIGSQSYNPSGFPARNRPMSPRCASAPAVSSAPYSAVSHPCNEAPVPLRHHRAEVESGERGPAAPRGPGSSGGVRSDPAVQPVVQRRRGAQEARHVVLGLRRAQPRAYRPLPPADQTFAAEQSDPGMVPGIPARSALEGLPATASSPPALSRSTTSAGSPQVAGGGPRTMGGRRKASKRFLGLSMQTFQLLWCLPSVPYWRPLCAGGGAVPE
jgi:hypothetical protein